MSRIDEALKQAGVRVPAREGAAEAPSDLMESFPSAPEMPSVEAERVGGPADPQQEMEPAPVSKRLLITSAERLVVNRTVEPVAVEQYRRLAAMLHQAQIARDVKVVMIASAQPSEGKTLTAANLALTLSESYRRRVLLVDADLRSPALGVIFQVPAAAGLSEGLRSAEEQPLHVIPLSPSLALLPGGAPDADPMAGLTSGRMQQIIQEAAGSFDWVILDTPPIGLMSDAHLLAAMVDVAVLVVSAGSTACATVQRAIESIGREKIAGVVLNRVEDKSLLEAKYYYNNRETAGASRDRLTSEKNQAFSDMPEVAR